MVDQESAFLWLTMPGSYGPPLLYQGYMEQEVE
jgi:hypothetical protein